MIISQDLGRSGIDAIVVCVDNNVATVCSATVTHEENILTTVHGSVGVLHHTDEARLECITCVNSADIALDLAGRICNLDGSDCRICGVFCTVYQPEAPGTASSQ